MLDRMFGRNKDLMLAGGVIAILLILFAPIPDTLLDLLIIFNFAFALTLLLLTFYVARPMEFSTFPSLLLVVTLYRLSLNVAATRLILTDAHAGDVIQAIGTFAVQGSFVIGLVVFLILVVVQYVVVTSGAQRVSEVAARFVLDSVPGQQMSIDADLNMGLIDQDEAKRRRKDLEKEAAFYGSMDGASKFVKGDAIAGIIILLINIFAGWIIGVSQKGMDWSEALQTFTLLTIGDGIVTQVPALIVSVATGIIVTRSSADRQLGEEVFRQLSLFPKVLLVVMATLLVLLALPGMPKWPIAILAVVGSLWFFSARRGQRSSDAQALQAIAASEAATDLAPAAPAPVEVLLGTALSDHWRGQEALLSERISALRTQHEKRCGLSLPAVVFRDGSALRPDEYSIMIFGARHGQSQLHPARTLAIGTGTRTFSGLAARDPAFGLPALWIEQGDREAAQLAGYTLVDPLTVLLTHLGEVLRTDGALLLSRSDVVRMLDEVRQRQPGLVEELVPNVLAVSDVQRVLQYLLAEDVSIANIDQIVETLVDVGRGTKDHHELTELVRQRLAHSICHGLRGSHAQLAVLSLHPRMEAQISEQVRAANGSGSFVIDPRLAEQLIRGLVPLAEAMGREGLSPVLLCGPDIRRHLKAFLRRTLSRLAVISVSEVPPNVDLSSFGVVAHEAKNEAIPAHG